jgi:ABC-type spermidine/putrescine transport system permease subunit I
VSWRQLVVCAIIFALLPGCTLNLTQIFIPLAYAGIGVGIALLVSPSVSAAVVGFVLGGIIGAAVYNNSLKADLMERQDLTPDPTGK